MDNVREINFRELKEGDIVWACAYTTNNTEKSMALKQKPIQGVIMKLERKGSYYSRKELSFVPYNAKGMPVKSRAVLSCSRTYARTEREAAIIYNQKVQKQIAFLNGLIDECKQDLI